MKRTVSAFVAALVLLTACKKPTASAPSPQQAAERVQQAYATVNDAMTKQAVGNLSDAMRKGDYEQAVVSLTTVRARPAATAEQQQAIIQSAQAIEINLINRMNAGDKSAERAYQLMKELKRN